MMGCNLYHTVHYVASRLWHCSPPIVWTRHREVVLSSEVKTILVRMFGNLKCVLHREVFLIHLFLQSFFTGGSTVQVKEMNCTCANNEVTAKQMQLHPGQLNMFRLWTDIIEAQVLVPLEGRQ